MNVKRDPSKPFWGVWAIGNLDGTFDACGPACHDTEEEAMQRMKEEIANCDPLQHVVFKCVPVVRHKRRPMIIQRFRDKS